MAAQTRTKQRGGLSPDQYLSEEQCRRLLRYLRKQSAGGCRRHVLNELIVTVLMYSGLRAEELLALRIRNLPCCHGKDKIFVEHGKGNVARAVDIPEWLSSVVTTFIRKYRKNAKPASYLVTSERGRRRFVKRQTRVIAGRQHQRRKKERSDRLTYHSLYAKIKRIGKAARIDNLHPHVFRHTYLTILYNIGEDAFYVADQAGHKDLKTTYKYAKTYSPKRIQQVKDLPRLVR